MKNQFICTCSRKFQIHNRSLSNCRAILLSMKRITYPSVKILSAAAFLFMLAGCAASPESGQPDSTTEYATVTSAGESAITMSIGSTRCFRTVQIGSDVVILRNQTVISADEIHVQDRLMCTYTNGQLSVIEVLSGNQLTH